MVNKDVIETSRCCTYVELIGERHEYRKYGPHYYIYHQNPNESKHNIGNWVPMRETLQYIMQNDKIVSVNWVQ